MARHCEVGDFLWLLGRWESENEAVDEEVLFDSDTHNLKQESRASYNCC